MLRFVETISVVGCGGIGSWLLAPLLRFLNSQSFSGDIHLWDGDRYSLANLSRQDAGERWIGRPKAEAQADFYRQGYGNLRIWHRNAYVSSENVTEAVPERSLIVVCVDNHPARALIGRQAELLRDVCVLSCGNERFDGNVCVALRRAGRRLTAPLLDRHPEIALSQQGDRVEMACEELAAKGETQLLVTNFIAAAAALSVIHALWDNERSPRRQTRVVPQEVFFDAAQCSMSLVPACAVEERTKRGVFHTQSSTATADRR